MANSSSVVGVHADAKAPMRTMRSSRGVSDASARVVTRRFDCIAASIGRIAFLSSIKSPRWLSSWSPIGVSSRSKLLGEHLEDAAALQSGMWSFSASSSGVGSRPISLNICRLVRTILLMVSIMCTGTRMVRD